MYSLLLIEDDHHCARMVSKVLESSGFSVHHAPNGLSGLRLARELHPDIILVDMDLPDLEGKVVVSKLRAEPLSQHLPIVAFTAESSVRARRLALAFGCDEFIEKPVDTRVFPQQVTEILHHHKHSRGKASHAQ